MEVTIISAGDTLVLRNAVLRPGLALAQCEFDGDHLANTWHFGAMCPGAGIVGVASVYSRAHQALAAGDACQLRGMAVAPAYRQQGVGKLLLAALESYALAQGVALVWANARSSAMGFYLGSGYSAASDEFHIEGLGPHFLVYKNLPVSI